MKRVSPLEPTHKLREEFPAVTRGSKNGGGKRRHDKPDMQGERGTIYDKDGKTHGDAPAPTLDTLG